MLDNSKIHYNVSCIPLPSLYSNIKCHYNDLVFFHWPFLSSSCGPLTHPDLPEQTAEVLLLLQQLDRCLLQLLTISLLWPLHHTTSWTRY